MPLNPSTLEKELLKQSEDAGNGVEVTYDRFVTALEKYANEIQYPPPTGVGNGIKMAKSLVSSIPTSPPLPIAIPLLKTAVQLLAIGIAVGKPINGPGGPAPGTGSGLFPTIPPAGQPMIDSILSQPNKRDVVASNLAIAIHNYMITGQYDSAGFVAPGTPPVPTPGPTPWT